MGKLEKAAQTLLKQCMGVKRNEEVLVLTDDSRIKIGSAIYEEAKKMSKEAFLVVMKPRQVNGQEPPKSVAKLMKDVDVVIMPLSKSLSHTKARKNATKVGVRIGSMPRITEDILIRGMTADYYKIRDRTRKLGKVLNGSDKVRITTKLGMDVMFSIKGKKIHGLNGGIFQKKGMWGNLPEGEACLAPVEGTTNGVIVIDKSFAGIGKLNGPLNLFVKNGYVVDVKGKDSKEFWKMFKKLPKKALNIAELGIGTNDKAKIIGNVLEDEKVLGTAHMAVGNNMSFEGTHDVPIHVDGVFSKPTIYVDGKVILKNGKSLVF